MESPLQSFLLSDVPGWDDDIVSAARFKAFTGQRTDWEGRFLFWKEVVIKVARHLNLLVIDADAVRLSWFLRAGLAPLCINQVLEEMYKRGDLEKLDKGQETLQNFNWILSHIRRSVFWASGIVSSTPADANSVVGRFIVTSLLHERIVEVIKTLSDNCWGAFSVTTMTHFTKLCGGMEEAHILKNELIRIKRGQYFVTDTNNFAEGLKISLTEDRIRNISKLDYYMLHLHWTLEKLQMQMDALEKAIIKSKQQAVRALQQKDRGSARRHTQSLKVLQASKSKCTNFQGQIQELSSFISQAEMTKQVAEAMKVGKDALKEHLVPLEDIQDCLSELDETLSMHKETANAIGYLTGGNEVDDLELQLSELELEDAYQQSGIPGVQAEEATHVTDQEQSTVSQMPSKTLETVESAMKGLTIELEPA